MAWALPVPSRPDTCVSVRVPVLVLVLVDFRKTRGHPFSASLQCIHGHSRPASLLPLPRPRHLHALRHAPHLLRGGAALLELGPLPAQHQHVPGGLGGAAGAACLLGARPADSVCRTDAQLQPGPCDQGAQGLLQGGPQALQGARPGEPRPSSSTSLPSLPQVLASLPDFLDCTNDRLYSDQCSEDTRSKRAKFNASRSCVPPLLHTDIPSASPPSAPSQTPSPP